MGYLDEEYALDKPKEEAAKEGMEDEAGEKDGLLADAKPEKHAGSVGAEPQNVEEAKAGEDAEKKDDKEEKAPIEIPNKQEGLFCCRRKGVHKLVINATQFFYIVLVVYFSNKLSMLLSDDAIGMVLGLLGYGLAIYVWFWVMPDMLDAYTLSTSIEMMKDRECVNKVIMI